MYALSLDSWNSEFSKELTSKQIMIEERQALRKHMEKAAERLYQGSLPRGNKVLTEICRMKRN